MQYFYEGMPMNMDLRNPQSIYFFKSQIIYNETVITNMYVIYKTQGMPNIYIRLNRTKLRAIVTFA